MATAHPALWPHPKKAQGLPLSHGDLPPLNNCLAFTELFSLNTALKIAAWLLWKGT